MEVQSRGSRLHGTILEKINDGKFYMIRFMNNAQTHKNHFFTLSQTQTSCKV